MKAPARGKERTDELNMPAEAGNGHKTGRIKQEASKDHVPIVKNGGPRRVCAPPARECDPRPLPGGAPTGS